LFWRAGAVFAFSNVFHFFAHKLTSLSTGRFAFTLVLVRAFNCFFFWHNKMVSPLATLLDVTKKRLVTSCVQETDHHCGNSDDGFAISS
jgi:hypothetical protein